MMTFTEGRLSYTVTATTRKKAAGAPFDGTAGALGGAEEDPAETRRGLVCQIGTEEDGAERTVFYEERDGTGMTTESTLELLPGEDIRVRLTRRGAVSAVFLFSVGEETRTRLETPYGALEVTVATELLEIEREQDRLRIRIRYRILESAEELHEAVYEIAL